MKSIAERVEALRQARGWTKNELARRSHLHQQHIYKLLAGERKHLSAETLIALAQAFEVTPNDILGWSERREDAERGQARVVESLQDSPPPATRDTAP